MARRAALIKRLIAKIQRQVFLSRHYLVYHHLSEVPASHSLMFISIYRCKSVAN